MGNMNRQAMSDALDGLKDKHPEANITGITTRVLADNQMWVEIVARHPYGTRGIHTRDWTFNIDEVEDQPNSGWDEGDEAKLLDLFVNSIKEEATHDNG